MAKAQYVGVNGVTRKVAKNYVGINGVAGNIKSGYVGVNGVARQYFSSGTLVRQLPIGSSLYINVSGVPKEFIVVEQGYPVDEIWDTDGTRYTGVYGRNKESNGTWLLMKDIYTTMKWDTSNNDYENSSVHDYLNNTFFPLLDSGVQQVVKTAKLPYMYGRGSNNEFSWGDYGLDAKVFLLSVAEINVHSDYTSNIEGSSVEYFQDLD